MRHSAVINTLDDLIEATIEINNKLYQFQMTTKPPKPNKYYQNHSAGYYMVKKDCKSFTNQYRDLIDLSVIQKKKADKKGGF